MKSLLRRLSDWCSGVPQTQSRHGRVQLAEPRSPLLIVVEGPHDAEFLRRISALLHGVHAELPALAQAEAAGQVSFLPAGGGNLWSWPARLGPLSLRQHIYDREIAPVTQQRQQLIDAINARPNCQAILTRKRAMENYLDPLAILQAGGVNIEFSDDDSVPLLVAQAVHRSLAEGPSWAELSSRARKRRCERAKCWLNSRAVECMTPELLQERDPDGEIAGWLRVANQLMEQAR